MVSSSAAASVDRANKGDRLAAPSPGGDRHSIAVIEVVGVNNAAIVYRDREGRELFRTDPVGNVTVVTKNVTLPEVTIRERPAIAPKPLALDPAKAEEKSDPAKTGEKTEEKSIEGCDPVASPLASPNLAHRTGRCLAALEGGKRLALAL
jgi:hypothetical protein